MAADPRRQPRVDDQLLAELQVRDRHRVDDLVLGLAALAGDRQRPANVVGGDDRLDQLLRARSVADHVDAPLVAVDRLAARVGADDELVTAVGVVVAGAQDQVDVAGLGVAGQLARIGDVERAVVDDQHAVVVSVRLRLRAGELLAAQRHRAGAAGRGAAVGEHELGADGRVIAVGVADAGPVRAVQLVGLQADRHLDLGGRLEQVAVLQVAEPARLDRHRDPLLGALRPPDRDRLYELGVVAGRGGAKRPGLLRGRGCGRRFVGAGARDDDRQRAGQRAQTGTGSGTDSRASDHGIAIGMGGVTLEREAVRPDARRVPGVASVGENAHPWGPQAPVLAAPLVTLGTHGRLPAPAPGRAECSRRALHRRRAADSQLRRRRRGADHRARHRRQRRHGNQRRAALPGGLHQHRRPDLSAGERSAGLDRRLRRREGGHRRGVDRLR